MQAPEDKEAVLSLYREGPAILQRALDGLAGEDLDVVVTDGGWTIRQVVHHLADGDDIWKSAIKMALGNEEAVFDLDWYQIHEQTTWADRWAYADRSADVSLNLLTAIREHVIQILECAPDTWTRAIRYRERSGEIVHIEIGAVIKMQADHVVHHVRQIEGRAGAVPSSD